MWGGISTLLKKHVSLFVSSSDRSSMKTRDQLLLCRLGLADIGASTAQHILGVSHFRFVS